MTRAVEDTQSKHAAAVGAVLLDPTSERSLAVRERLPRPATLAGLTVGLLDISKP